MRNLTTNITHIKVLYAASAVVGITGLGLMVAGGGLSPYGETAFGGALGLLISGLLLERNYHKYGHGRPELNFRYDRDHDLVQISTSGGPLAFDADGVRELREDMKTLLDQMEDDQ